MIAHLAHGADAHPGAKIGQLFPQEGDVDLHVVVLRLRLQAPYLGDDVLLGNDGPGGGQQQAEHVELLEAQPDGFFPAAQAAGGGVQHQIPGGELLAGHLALPPGEGPHPGQQLPDVEGLGHIVVRAVIQPRDLVRDLIPGGEHQNGGGDVGAAQAAGHLEAVHLGKHHIEHNGVVLPGEGVVQPVRPVEHHVGLIALLRHDLAQRLGQAALVLYNQDAHTFCPFLRFSPL